MDKDSLALMTTEELKTFLKNAGGVPTTPYLSEWQRDNLPELIQLQAEIYKREGYVFEREPKTISDLYPFKKSLFNPRRYMGQHNNPGPYDSYNNNPRIRFDPTTASNSSSKHSLGPSKSQFFSKMQYTGNLQDFDGELVSDFVDMVREIDTFYNPSFQFQEYLREIESCEYLYEPYKESPGQSSEFDNSDSVDYGCEKYVKQIKNCSEKISRIQFMSESMDKIQLCNESLMKIQLCEEKYKEIQCCMGSLEEIRSCEECLGSAQPSEQDLLNIRYSEQSLKEIQSCEKNLEEIENCENELTNSQTCIKSGKEGFWHKMVKLWKNFTCKIWKKNKK